MKPLIKTKWVLTGSLLVALGFNVTLNNHEAGIATADFASTLEDGVVEGKLHTAKGVVSVKYIDNGEDKVLAIVPKKMTEGGVCDNCGFETISLNVQNKGDIDSLNVELLKVLEKTRETVVTTDASESSVTVSKIPTDEVDFFASLEKCDTKSSDSAVLDCRVTGYIKLLKNKSLKISQEDSLEYYKDSIEPLIAGQLAASRATINQMRRSSVMSNNQWFAFEDDFSSDDPNSIRQDTLEQIEDLIAGLPRTHTKVRDRVLATQALVIKAEAIELQSTMNQSRTTTDPQMGMYLLQEGQLRQYDLKNLMTGMLTTTQSGLQVADISSAQKNYYMNALNTYTTELYQGMNSNIYGFADATGAPSLDGRLGGASRVSSLPFATPANAEAIFKQQNQIFTNMPQTPSVVITQPTSGATALSPSGVPMIPTLSIPELNTGIVFGTAIPITQESLLLRQGLRTQFSQ